MKFRFPIVIIDEDFRSENASGLGIRALAAAIEKEGMEVLGVTSYGDLSQFAQQQSRASAFILSIDDEEFTPGPELDPAVLNLRKFIEEIRFKNAEIPIYLYGETRTSRHVPERRAARAARLHPHVRGHAGVRRPPHHPRGEELPRLAGAAVLPRAGRLRAGRLVLVALSRATRAAWRFSKARSARCSTSSSARTCCAPTSATRSTSSGSCSTIPAPSAQPSATRRASSMPTTASSSPTVRRRRTRWCGTRTWRRTTSSSSTATATSRSCTRSR